MDNRKGKLLKISVMLYKLGVELGNELDVLCALVNSGVSYNSPQMPSALKRYRALNEKWKEQEKQ